VSLYKGIFVMLVVVVEMVNDIVVEMMVVVMMVTKHGHMAWRGGFGHPQCCRPPRRSLVGGVLQ
jgi:hypothetical protein